MNAKKQLVKYDQLNREELLVLIELKDECITQLKTIAKISTGEGNDNIQAYIENIAVELGEMFKLDLAQKIELISLINKSIKTFLE